MIRGDVYRLPAPRRARGHEQRGPRYGVIVQGDEFNDLSTVIVAPTSQAARPAAFRPSVEIGHEQTRVMVEQLRTLDLERLGKHSGRLSWRELVDVDRALRLLLAL